MKTRVKLILSVILMAEFLVSLPGTAGALGEKMRIAIMGLKGIGVSESTTETVSDLLRTELFNTGLFRMIERTEMDQILKEQEFQQTGCTETKCAVEIGKLLSVKKILIGTVSKLGEKLIINARIVDVEKGEMEFADMTECGSESQLLGAVRTFTRKLANRIQGVLKATEIKRGPEIVGAEVLKKHREYYKFGIGFLTGTWVKLKWGKLGSMMKDYSEAELNFDLYLGLSMGYNWDIWSIKMLLALSRFGGKGNLNDHWDCKIITFSLTLAYNSKVAENFKFFLGGGVTYNHFSLDLHRDDPWGYNEWKSSPSINSYHLEIGIEIFAGNHFSIRPGIEYLSGSTIIESESGFGDPIDFSFWSIIPFIGLYYYF